jgi:hypothetical protein
MSKFKLIVEDEAMPFLGSSKIRHEFEADELGPILTNMTKFLQSSGYLDTQKRLSIERVVDLRFDEDDDLDNIEQFFGALREHAQNLDKSAQETKFGALYPYNGELEKDCPEPHSPYYYDTERNK